MSHLKHLALTTLRLLIVFGAGFSSLCYGETIRVAVASNFVRPMEAIKLRYEQGSDDQLIIISGSSGKHFAQISNGAPFDLFLSADTERPRLLAEQAGVLLQDRQAYAIGRLALWSASRSPNEEAVTLFYNNEIGKLSIANPKLAPYGRAAREYLESLPLKMAIGDKLVTGENVAQAFQYAYSGHADYGFIALSQALSRPETGAYWVVPQELHEPITQEMVLLSSSPGAARLFEYLGSDALSGLLNEFGYHAPAELHLR